MSQPEDIDPRAKDEPVSFLTWCLLSFLGTIFFLGILFLLGGGCSGGFGQAFSVLCS